VGLLFFLLFELFLASMPLPLEQLEPLARCPVCNKKHRRGLRMLPVAEEDKRTMLHVTCEHCGGKTLVAVSVTPFGMVSLGVLTDLDQSEAKRTLSAEPVSADQVIAAHQFFKQHEGGVEELIG
jgi:DNA-directed RNA polymerase subunit RPC12/RpoP